MDQDCIEVNELDEHLDTSKRLLFTETRMRAAPEHVD